MGAADVIFIILGVAFGFVVCLSIGGLIAHKPTGLIDDGDF